MADTFRDRVAQAIGDPGSITNRRADGDIWGGEKMTRWQTRAVLQVVSEHRYDFADEIGKPNPIGVAVLLAFYGLLMLGAGLWLGAVWL